MSTVRIDDLEIEIRDGETVLQAAARLGIDIPTLCNDPRLKPFGGCRLCMVEVEGARAPVASCTTPAVPGMVVRTGSEAIERHRKTILELLASENPERFEGPGGSGVDPLRGMAATELDRLLDRYGADRTRFGGRTSGRSRTDDDNPFIARDYDLCISCYRCVRVCAEQEGDYAISVSGRGFGTSITAGMNGLLKDSECTFCGQCVQTCPTGALADKKAMRASAATETTTALKSTRTICGYCGVGCSVDLLTRDDRIVAVRPAMDGPANEGALCVKGQFAFDYVHHRDRLRTPLVRNDQGELEATDWETALDRAAEGLRKAHDEHGRHSIYAVASGRTPHEAAYTLQKLMRAGFGTNYIDNCSRA